MNRLLSCPWALPWATLSTAFGLLAFPTPESVAQEVPAYAEHLEAGQDALGSGDHPAAVAALEEAARLIAAGNINRPFVQYHLARALALEGRGAEAVSWLDVMWEEAIEGLMLHFAEYDPAFDDVRDGESYLGVIRRADDLVLESTHLGGSVHLLVGAGSNIVASIGSDGALLVDTGYAPAEPAIRRALEGLGEPQVRYVVNTHAHEDHLGGNAAFAETARIIAHPETREAMGDLSTFIDGVQLPPRPETALPDMAVAEESRLEFNGEAVRIVALPAHTTGDLVVYFEGSDVLHMGDNYFPDRDRIYPGPTDPERFLASLGSLLDHTTPRTTVVGGHDPPTPIERLRDQFEGTSEVITFVREGIDEGDAVDELIARAERRGLPLDWVEFYYGVMASSLSVGPPE